MIEMDKFIIRNYNKSDITNYIELFMNENVMHFLPHLREMSEKDHLKDFNSLLKDITSNDRTQYRFALIEKSKNRFIGEVGFILTSKTPKGHRGELAYFTHPEFWSRGYTKMAVKEVIRYGFRECGIHKFTAGCLKDNIASSSILKRFMKKEGEFKEHAWVDGSWKDNLRYGLTKEDWLLL